jgi:hypothetical protein
MTTAAQTLSTMLEALPPKEQESVIDKVRPIIADAMDEMKWNSSYKKSEVSLGAFAQKVRGLDKKLLIIAKL